MGWKKQEREGGDRKALVSLAQGNIIQGYLCVCVCGLGRWMGEDGGVAVKNFKNVPFFAFSKAIVGVLW